MAEAITIPSPSRFLSSADPSPAVQTSAKKAARRSQPPAPKDVTKASDGNGISKRKLSKSRNGCITCKAKRLKCDETKPKCQQCVRRNVECGGYKKDFKWRAFEEASFTGKPACKPKKGASPPSSGPSRSRRSSPAAADDVFMPLATTGPVYSPTVALSPSPIPIPGPIPSLQPLYFPPDSTYNIHQTSPYILGPPPISPAAQFAPGSVESSHSSFERDSIDTRPSRTTAASSISSGQSPRLLDLLLPGTDLSVPPEEYYSYRSQYPESFYQPSGFTPPAGVLDDDDVEEIPRDFGSDWFMRLPSPTPSSSTSSSSDSSRLSLMKQPQFPSDSPEALTHRFDRDTCGILSVKDGPTENPWRTLVWPLARDCPALYHAIASMTSFHHSSESRIMRLQGIDHSHLSIRELASGLRDMHIHAAISTTLVLAFSESWDQHISTGKNHIKGAKLLIDEALFQHKQRPVQGDELSRLAFLCNSWLYMDVIARLSSADGDDFGDFDEYFNALDPNGRPMTQLDPLMGCASSLFPILGRVANLVRKARMAESNTPSIISQAMDLKMQLEDWVPPASIEDPEDETTNPHDAQRTARAYQYATLLYLHQAVPEIPSLKSAELARNALCELATVRPSSRSVIVSIYPLMVAGCEAVLEEDREWVRSRWRMLSSRMKLGILEKCQEVTQEVWNRRDAYAEAMLQANSNDDVDSPNTVSPTSPLKRRFSSAFQDDADTDADGIFCWLDVPTSKRRLLNAASGLFEVPQPAPVFLPMTSSSEFGEGRRRSDLDTEALPVEFTVKGRLHWLGVMRDWGWEEVLLG